MRIRKLVVVKSFLPWLVSHIPGIPGLVNIQKAIENGPVEIVDVPIKHGGFP